MTFADFWKLYYPLRRGHPNPKPPALQEWERSLNRGKDPADIMEGTRRFAAYCQKEGTDPRYIPHARRFLHNDEWEAFLPTEEELEQEAAQRDETNKAIARAIRNGQRMEFLDGDRLAELETSGHVTADEIRKVYG